MMGIIALLQRTGLVCSEDEMRLREFGLYLVSMSLNIDVMSFTSAVLIGAVCR